MNLRFPGQYHDRETGLYQNWHREYVPKLGRYTQSDPTGYQGGINLFLYANANPSRFADPDGLSPNQSDYSICSYYDGVAERHGCNYHKAAADICRGTNRLVNAIAAVCGITAAKLSCIRECLVTSDKSARRNPSCQVETGGCGVCTKKSCIDAYHNKCFSRCGVSPTCYGGNYGPYPNDGG